MYSHFNSIAIAFIVFRNLKYLVEVKFFSMANN